MRRQSSTSRLRVPQASEPSSPAPTPSSWRRPDEPIAAPDQAFTFVCPAPIRSDAGPSTPSSSASTTLPVTPVVTRLQSRRRAHLSPSIPVDDGPVASVAGVKRRYAASTPVDISADGAGSDSGHGGMDVDDGAAAQSQERPSKRVARRPA